MSDKNNKVKYNLKNAHYALLTIGEDGAVSYAAPVPLPGSVSLSLDANGEPENFYADGIAYYVINNNMGYDGDLELALIPESFRTDVLREKLDAKGVLIENSDAELALFALLFEFDGDVRHIRHVMYNCSASRPKIEGKTNEEKKEVQTETLTVKATPLSDGKVKAKTGECLTMRYTRILPVGWKGEGEDRRYYGYNCLCRLVQGGVSAGCGSGFFAG